MKCIISANITRTQNAAHATIQNATMYNASSIIGVPSMRRIALSFARSYSAFVLRTFVLALALPFVVLAQSGVRFDGLTLSPSGRPVSASVAVCNSPGLITTGAQVIGNTAILTFGSNPITAGFAQNMQIVVSGFTGADTFFNSGTLQPFSSTVTIIGISTSTISYQLTHANASATSNGSVLQMGNVSTPCAPLAAIYSDAALATLITQPGFFSSGIGNVGFYVNPGQYAIQYYGSGVTTYLQPLTLTMLFSTGNNTFSGNNTFNGNDTYNGTETFNNGFTVPAGQIANVAGSVVVGQNFRIANTLQNFAGTSTMGLTFKTGSGVGDYTGNNTLAFISVDTTNLCAQIVVPIGWKLKVDASGALGTNTAAVTTAIALADAGATCGSGGVTALSGTQRHYLPSGVGTNYAGGFAVNYVLTGDGNVHSISLVALTSAGADAWVVQNSAATVSPSMTFLLMPSN